MACIKPDGTLTGCGEHLLLAMWNPATPEEVAGECKVPLFRVRSTIRQFLEAGLVERRGESYVISRKGIDRMEGRK